MIARIDTSTGSNDNTSPARLDRDTSALPLGNGGPRSASRKMPELLQEGMLEPGSLPASVPGLHDLKVPSGII